MLNRILIVAVNDGIGPLQTHPGHGGIGIIQHLVNHAKDRVDRTGTTLRFLPLLLLHMADDVVSRSINLQPTCCAKFRRRCDTLPFFTVVALIVVRLKVDGVMPIGIKDGIGTLDVRDSRRHLDSGPVGVLLGTEDGGGIDKVATGTASTTTDGRSGAAHLDGVVGGNGRGETSHGHRIFVIVARFGRRRSADARRPQIGHRSKRLRQRKGGKVVRQIGRREGSRQLLLRRRSLLGAARP
mmetsp:Transcript_33778/g.99538  ORF Transcript_33778/g.99538 Transcript_33778/m.99538 type:complete len:240 (-) Transcript_33778:249-968(-)